MPILFKEVSCSPPPPPYPLGVRSPLATEAGALMIEIRPWGVYEALGNGITNDTGSYTTGI